MSKIQKENKVWGSKKKNWENDRRSTLESLQQTWEENNQFAKIVAAADNAKEKEKNHKAIISNTF